MSHFRKFDYCQVTTLDLWWMILATVRYSLGRRSTAASDAMKIVLEYKPYLTDGQIAQLAREIDGELERVPAGRFLGDECDHRVWITLSEELKKPPTP